MTLDAAQRQVFEKLESLSFQLNQIFHSHGSFFGKLKWKKLKRPKGLYVWGDVGRGKTFLMDQFFETLKSPRKLRLHFHAFMQQVHSTRTDIRSDDIISDIAKDFARDADVLCLDEMQISDIADAMLIGRLFDALHQCGVCFVTTSNLPPDQLYKDGLNRQLFLPFIAKLNSLLEIVHLADGVDYRLGRMASRQTYITPLDQNTDAEIETIWTELTDGAPSKPEDLQLLGRTLHVPQAARAYARFGFGDLCEQPLAAPDYLALAKKYRVIFIEHVPIFKVSQRNETKRFILMIDMFYDLKTKVVISAQASADKLCTVGQHKSEFLRTASRLQEMQSAGWWKP